jgi:hypothetical protein
MTEKGRAEELCREKCQFCRTDRNGRKSRKGRE